MASLLIALATCYILIKIPFWVLGSIRGGRRSAIGRIVRAILVYKTFGLVRGLAGTAATSSLGDQRFWKTRQPDPYARSQATAGGQFLLPLPGLKRTRTPKPTPQTRPQASAKTTAVRGRQLALPLGKQWPEHRPRPGRDGQYQLPWDVRRQKPARDPQPAHSITPSARTPRGRQLRLPLDVPASESTPRLGRDGQYRLPLDVRRVRRPTPPSPPAPPSRPSRPAARQLRLPADGQWPEHRPRLGRDGQYQLPLQVRRVRTFRHRTPTPPPGASTAPRQLALPLDLPRRTRRTTTPRPHRGGRA